MDRLLIVPAAGRGSRLGSSDPKALVQVAGMPMLDHLLAMHRATVEHVVVVVAPDAVDAFARFVAARDAPVELAVQQSPTGMLDAIALAAPVVAVRRPRRVAVTWCDQIAIADATIRRVYERAISHDAAPLLLPTLMVDCPYIHFERDTSGRIVHVLQRREGDVMPDRGETDMGLFDLSLAAYLDDLTEFSQATSPHGATGERNFLPFIPWLAGRRPVETVPGGSVIETVGVNTPAELAAIEAHLAGSRSVR
jgi:bifunctional N-acetylglucosamine-1-phosphate-uridyltransferase/glucosamine-1-phosphate-acetyltransferase GlmU-like protein